MWTSIAVLTSLVGIALADNACPSKQDEEWSYGGSNGPDNWGDNFTQCNGRNQSPIEINPSNALLDDDEANGLTTFGYDIPVISAKLENNGKAVYVRPSDRVSRGIRIGGETYTLVESHFHFGKNSSEGSEHIITGEEYAMEFHLVHRNQNNELAVVGIFFEEMNRDNLALLPITLNLMSIKYEGESTNIFGLILKKLFPHCIQPVYYTYQGSLTTPPCSEGVRWFVVNGATPVSTRQMGRFRSLFETKRGEAPCQLAGNFRKPQPLNERVVSKYTGDCIS